MILFLSATEAYANTYYVDWGSGLDSNNGTACGTPWKHAPGDQGATGNANRTLQAGDIVVFKGGVIYLGTATPANPPRTGQLAVVATNNSGSPGNPIVYVSGDIASNYGATNCGTGKGVLDGRAPAAGSIALGFFVGSTNFITIDGLEIRNIGWPNSQQGGVDAAIVDIEGGSNLTVRNCKLHDVDFTFSPSSGGYGIENNHGANHLYEKNEIYNYIDKAFEAASGVSADVGSNDANNGIVRYNYIHDSPSHGAVITGNGWQVYDNIFSNIGITTAFAGGRDAAFATKVDKGQGNKIWNNIAYNTNAGFGCLGGFQNDFVHNVVYGVSNQAGGDGGSPNNAGLVLSTASSNSTWPAGHKMDQNHVYNNIVYYINFTNGSGQPVFFAYQADGGSGNEVKDNVFFAASGDTVNTANRINFANNSSFTVASFQTNFNMNEGGSNNVASGNIVKNPFFPGDGGTIGGAFTQPTGFNAGFTDLNNNSYHFTSLANGITTPGITVLSPENLDITGNPRSTFWPGVYDSTGGCTPSQLIFSTQPTGVDLGATIPSVAVTIKDSNGNTCSSATNSITLAKDAGATWGSLNATGNDLTKSASSGVATWTSDLYVTGSTGTGSIDATSSGLTSATSNSITITCTPNRVVFSAQPINLGLGATEPTVSVSIVNAFAFTCTAATNSITLAKDPGATWSTLNSANLTKTAVAGTASWSDLSITGNPGGGAIDATSSGLAASVSNSITITEHGPGIHLRRGGR